MIAEVYPSIFRNRYQRGERTPHEQDADSVARWLVESSKRGILERPFQPPLTIRERAATSREG